MLYIRLALILSSSAQVFYIKVISVVNHPVPVGMYIIVKNYHREIVLLLLYCLDSLIAIICPDSSKKFLLEMNLSIPYICSTLLLWILFVKMIQFSIFMRNIFTVYYSIEGEPILLVNFSGLEKWFHRNEFFDLVSCGNIVSLLLIRVVLGKPNICHQDFVAFTIFLGLYIAMIGSRILVHGCNIHLCLVKF